MSQSVEKTLVSSRYRVPIAAIAVFGVSAMMTLAVAIVLYLGLTSATRNTSQLWADQSDGLIDDLEHSIEVHLRPVRDQAHWITTRIADGALDLTDTATLDGVMFGALAATPQVTGLAIVTADAKMRSWGRAQAGSVTRDWSGRREIVDWVRAGEQQQTSAWRAPIWTAGSDMTVILHDTPLRSASGEYLGMLGQIIPVTSLSQHLAERYPVTGLTWFILYDRQYVLVHPLLVSLGSGIDESVAPLPRIDELGDVVLEKLWSPDDTEPGSMRDLVESEAVSAQFGDNYYLYIYRDIRTFGPQPWTVGVYLNTSISEDGELQRILVALIGGLVVLVLAAGAAIYAGRRISKPIQAIASAAEFVEDRRFDEVPRLRSSRIRELDDAGRSFNHMVHGLRERELIRETLGRFVPEEVAVTLLSGGGDLQPQQVEATILFCDLEDFTRLTEALGPVGIVNVLNAFFSAMVEILERHGGVATQFQGDAILATFNVPLANPEHAGNALRAAGEMQSAVDGSEFADQRLSIRIGINTGSVVAGAVGAQGRLSYTVHGDAVNLAARLEALNKQYGSRVLVSENTAGAVAGFDLRAVGETGVRGQSGMVKLFELKV